VKIREAMRTESLINHLKQFYEKSDTNNFNVEDFVSAFGSPLLALTYSYLFWPDFVVFDGMIFHQTTIETDDDRAQIRAALSKLSSRKEVEQSFNQFMLPDDLFSAGTSTTTDEENLYLAQRLKEMWEARLARVFPDRKCVVELQLPDETQEGPTIIVYQA
jgi:hypothetical protein